MLCEKCHNRLGSIRYREVVDGKVMEKMICPSCYNAMQEGGSVGFEISGSAPAPKGRLQARRRGYVRAAHQTCHACGLEWKQVLDERETGCPVCFESFEGLIAPLISDGERHARHRGKVPRRDDSREQLRSELHTKRALLRSALTTENYEEAAQLRDDIRTLESSLSATTGSEA
jgi:protein arginine kinase activator